MKILVDEMPVKPEECLFSRKEKYMDTFTIPDMRKITLYTHHCNVDGKQCELDFGCECCNKLKTLEMMVKR